MRTRNANCLQRAATTSLSSVAIRARRSVVDAAAAAVLLQAALDAERATGLPPGQLVDAAGGASA